MMFKFNMLEESKMTDELQELLQSYKSYSERAIQQLDAVSEKCYQNEQAFVWDAVEDFVDAMEYITKGLVYISNTYESFSALNHVFTEQFKGLLQAMEDKDMVAIGDILSYEIKPLFVKLLVKMERVSLDSR